ncbi:MAG: hypothetical protein FJX00_02515 [Alphaproteobacteria bacterium]|nr:hypothetical protein [Alphaproteobacteria bacterium]
MSPSPMIKLNVPIEFFEKIYSEDERGGRIIAWKSLGQGWGNLNYARARYPLVFENQRHYRGAVYDVIVRDNPMVNQADKIVYNHQDLFYLYSPQLHSKGLLKIRLFAWEKQTEREIKKS